MSWLRLYFLKGRDRRDSSRVYEGSNWPRDDQARSDVWRGCFCCVNLWGFLDILGLLVSSDGCW